MPRKHNSFERALVDAEKRLGQALNERSQAQETLNDLAKEIPNLQRTVAALESQLNPQPDALASMPLSGPGSVRIEGLSTAPGWPTSVITEDDTLPEPEGTPVTPED